jgi:N-acetylneuraminic acid mutarotase
MCVIAGELYVTGGYCRYGSLATVERYSPSSNTWNSVAAMPQARLGHEACEVNGYMYVVGGYLQQTWKYDAEADMWSEMVPSPTPALLLGTATCSIGTDMYVIGGRISAGIPQSDVYKYNTVNNTWSTVSPMPTARFSHGACVVGGMIYVVGGYEREFTVVRSALCYDPLLDKWTAVACMSQVRSKLAVFALDECVYAAGGRDHWRMHININLSTVEKYEPALDRWSAAPSMTVPRDSFKALAWKVEENELDVMIRQALQSSMSVAT